VPITQADVDDDEAMNSGRRHPTTITDAASVDDDKVTSGGRHRPTTALLDLACPRRLLGEKVRSQGVLFVVFGKESEGC